MIGQDIVDALGDGLSSSFGQLPGTDSPGAAVRQEMSTAAGFDGTSTFSPQS